jgi:hypothetical protein
MLNTTGVLAVLDRGVTINWDDGPTLHRITAQVRYHTTSMATTKLVRVNASQKFSEDPLSFIQEDGLKVTWTWIEGNDGDSDVVYWTTQLAVTNQTDEVVYLDAMDVIRIDSAYSGQFNLGAPPGLWQCTRENNTESLEWEAWSESTATAGGFTRNGLLLVQPVVSNRTRPPALLVRVDENPQDESGRLPVEIKLDLNGERFERLVAHNRADGTLLAPGVTVVSTRFLIASGDNADELRRIKTD